MFRIWKGSAQSVFVLMCVGSMACDKDGPSQVVILESGGGAESQSLDGAAPPLSPVKMAESSPTPHPYENTQIVPGHSLGPMVHLTSYDDLVKIYGEDSLSPKTLTLQDGEKRLGTRIAFAKGEEVTVIWWDDTRRTLREARELGKGWKTAEGIYEGITLEELEASIGAFQVFGFGWANGGGVKLRGTRGAKYRDKLHLRMVPTRRYQENLARLSGDTWYDSSDETLRAVKPIIRDMVVSFEP